MNIRHETNFNDHEMEVLNKLEAVFRMENGNPIYRVFLKNSIFEVRRTNALGLYECVVADKNDHSLAYGSGKSMNESIEKTFHRYLKITKDDDSLTATRKDLENFLLKLNDGGF